MYVADLFHSIIDKLTGFELAVILSSWASAVIGAALAFFVQNRHGRPRNGREFLRFCFPREVIFSRSAFLDLGYAVTYRLLRPLIVAPLVVSATLIAGGVGGGLDYVFGPHPPTTPDVWVKIACIAAIIVVVDFATFYTHYLEHKIPVLWEFHKVHHAAVHLIPLTNRRFHPVQAIIDEGFNAFLYGISLGVIAHYFGMGIGDVLILGLDAYYFVQILCFYHLRHSHIHLTFGPLEGVLMSPAQHHIHHSIEERHWDKNFGLCLTIWDRLFGTWIAPEERRTFALGLDRNEHLEYSTVPRLWLLPFQKVWRRWRGAARRSRPSPSLSRSGRPAADGPAVGRTPI